MEHWIFQANPDRFYIDKYIEDNTNIVWTVRQKHFLKAIEPGDEIFMWRAAGKSKGVSGIVSRGIITDLASRKAGLSLRNIRSFLLRRSSIEVLSRQITQADKKVTSVAIRQRFHLPKDDTKTPGIRDIPIIAANDRRV